MSCTEYREAIGALVDGTIELTDRRALERHLEACPACTALVDDLLVLKRAAKALPALAPPDAVRPRIEQAVIHRDRPFRLPRRVLVPLAAAALLVVATLAGVAWWRASSGPEAPAAIEADAGTASAPELKSVEAELQLAETHFQNAIAELEALTKDQQVLEPEVAAEVQKNLQVIDRAIGESRAALRAEPTSVPAQESLFEAFRSKIALLQDTIALINEMRKGDQAGAARIAEQLNKS